MKLRDNKWGYDISLDNPFRIFPVLAHVASKSVGEKNVVDLSRGDPGFGYCPSVRGREFFAFLLELDVNLNTPEEHFVADNQQSFDELWERICNHANSIYKTEKAKMLIEDFDFFIKHVQNCAASQGLDWDNQKVLFEIFKFSLVSGGSYLEPQGEVLSRVVIASHYNSKLSLGIDYKDIVLISGVSHGIGTIFELLCDKSVGYLNEGDSVLISSPVYSPYNAIIGGRSLKTYAIDLDPTTGEVVGDIDEILANAPDNLKLICLIDPNNPTGFMSNESFLKKIADFAKERDILIVSDEVYADFFPNRDKGILNFAPERSVFIGGRSKIERSTGLRFGEYVVTKEGQNYIANSLLKGKLGKAHDFIEHLVFSKAPGGVNGEFQHVTFVPGPSQYLGIAHMIFGKKDRDEYLDRISANMKSFYEILELPYNDNLYYACFDLLKIPGCNKGNLEPEEIFYQLAKRGVVLIPVNLFFANGRYNYFARGSLPNLTLEKLKKAAHIIKEYITS